MYGVIDIGSNTIRLVIYKVENNTIIPMINKKNAVGLAGYVDENGNLSETGIIKTIEALNEFKELTKYIKIEEIFPFATASLRNINNSATVIKKIENKTGYKIRLLSGDEEATFDYYGVLQSIDINSGLVVDIGGGSTELVFFKNKKMLEKKSIPIGSLNLFKKYVNELIPTKKEQTKMCEISRQRLSEINQPSQIKKLNTICAVGGTARAIEKLLNDMKLSDGAYNYQTLEELIKYQQNNSSTFYRFLLKSSPDRIHTFIPGLMILNETASKYNANRIITSKYGVREGYLRQILEEKGVIKL